MINKLKPKSEYARNIVTVMTGTSIAQAIPIIISPILTRLYSPEDFGLYAIFASMVGIVVVIGSGRYDAAIMLPKSENDAINVLGAALLIAIMVSGLVLLGIIVFYESLMRTEELNFFGLYLYLLPVMILIGSFYTIFYNWINRQKKFKHIAFVKVGQTSSTAFINVILGIKSFQSTGLIFGQFFGQLIALGYLFYISFRHILWRNITFKKMKQQILKYSNFPKYDIPASFLNVFSIELPIFILGFLFSPAIVGIFSLSRRVVGMPVLLLSSSITAVFKQRATSDYNEYGECSDIYKKTFRSLFLIALIPFILLFIFAPQLFSFIFGSDWMEAGEYTQILIPMFFLRFISSPLSYMFYIVHKQKINMIGQGSLLISTALGMLIGYWFDSVFLALSLFSAASSIFYLIYLYISYTYSKGIT